MVERSGSIQTARDNARTEQLLFSAQRGDDGAFGALYEEYVERIYRYIYLKVGQVEEAQDLTQEVFLHALKGIGSYREQGALFQSWLFRIAHNLIVDHYRKQKGREATLLSQLEGEDAMLIVPDPLGKDNQEAKCLERLELKQAIDRLPPQEKEVISLRFGGELSIVEASRAMGKSEGTVKKLQFVALAKLRKFMSEGE